MAGRAALNPRPPSSVPRPPSCLFCSTSHSLPTVALFVPAPQRSPLVNPLPPPAALPFACRRANLRGLCLSCFAAIPSCAPSSSCSSSSFSTQWRVKSVNRRRRQSVLQVAATTACLPCPALAWHGRAWLLHYPLHLPLSLPGHLPASPELAMFLIEKRFFNYVSQLLFGAAAAAAAPTAPGWLPCCVPFNLLFLLPFRYPWACRKSSRVATTHNDE